MDKLTYEESHKEIDRIPHKLCKKCNEWKICDERHFYKHRATKDGLSTYCRECNKILTKEKKEDKKNNYNQEDVVVEAEGSYSQDKIYVNDIEIPIVVKDRTRYIPLGFTSRKLMNREQDKSYYKRYSVYPKIFLINYDYENKNIQPTKCISEYQLKEWLESLNLNKCDDKTIDRLVELSNLFNIDFKAEKFNPKHISIKERYGEDVRQKYLNHDAVGIFNHYLNIRKQNKTYGFPKMINNKEDIGIILKCLYSCGEITKENLTKTLLVNKLKSVPFNKYYTIYEIYELIFGRDFILERWKYRKLSYTIEDIEVAKKIVRNYIEQNSDEYKNLTVYELPYTDIMFKCMLYNFNRDILNFAMEFHDRKYPAYKFKIQSVNYYKDKQHRIDDFKWFIENDLRVPIEKIPIYLTKSILQTNAPTLRRVLRKYYNNNIFKIVNECYPNTFIENDFGITKTREKFDSDAEEQIDDILRKKFDNVLYNSRKQEQCLKIQGMIPDWILFTDKGCYIVEYFGLYAESKESTMIKKYVEKTHEKLKKYESINGYNKLFIYPEDLKNNFSGIYEKIDNIQQSLNKVNKMIA